MPDDVTTGGPGRRWGRRIAIGVGIVAAALVLVIGLLALLPVSTAGLGATPNPATTYAAATDRFETVVGGEASVRPVCRSRLLTEGRRTARVVVLFHGLTNCPRQMLDLARTLHADGANVLVLRAPGHGFPGGVENMADVTAEDFRDFASRSVDIAHGLGAQTTVVGLSLGGMLAAWSAQERPDVYRAVIIAPAFALGSVPSWVNDAFVNAFSRLPNINVPGGVDSVPHGYPPGTATRPTAQMFRLSAQVMQRAGGGEPRAKYLDLIINDNDTTVSNDAALAWAARWRSRGQVVTLVRIPACLGLPHDIIDAAQPRQDIAFVYPIVVDMAEGKTPPPITPQEVAGQGDCPAVATPAR